ncbi:putative adhesin [Streptomyces sp. IBSNAI002]|uniref:putative adhesin n=1 Tax=Streptomyces sp. IBSNAI002 TaxID=3457500 RepID=UPI003FD19817
MASIVFEGHGNFYPSTLPPMTTVPDNSAIFFFTEGLKGLSRGDAEELLSKDSFELAAIESQASRVIEGGSGVFNYSLSPDVATQDYSHYAETARHRGIELVTVATRTLLSDLFAFYGANHRYYWLACSTVALSGDTWGEMLGVNTPQLHYGSNSPGQWDERTQFQDYSFRRPRGVCAEPCGVTGCTSVCRHVPEHRATHPQHRCHRGHQWSVQIRPNPVFNQRGGNVTPGY